MLIYVIQKRRKANKAQRHMQYNRMNVQLVPVESIEINLSKMFLQLIVDFYICTPK
jgi:hypothetical protein